MCYLSIPLLSNFAFLKGLKEAICKEATRTVQNDIKYEKSLKNTINKLPEKQFKYMENIFPNHLLSWMGGSIFAALKVFDKIKTNVLSVNLLLLL